MSPEIRFPRRSASADPVRAASVFLVGLAVGSGLMYLFDSRAGNRRRAVARDKAFSIVRRSGETAGKTARHLRNKLGGMIATLGSACIPAGAISDRKLEDHIRSAIGRAISQPHAVDFAVHDGRVTVRGVLKPHETGSVLRAIERIKGVRSVDNQVLDSAPQNASTSVQ